MLARRMSRAVIANSNKMVRLNSTHAYVEDKSKGAMLRYQESLPKLPVPTLEETAVRYLKSIQPLATPEQYAASEAALKSFLQKEGPELQKKLLAKANDPSTKNWMYDWWNNEAYLEYRDPVVPYVSYFYSHKDDKLRKAPAQRAAYIATAVLDFKRQVDTGALEPEYMKKNPICMDAYKWMFNVSRVPARGTDKTVTYDKSQNKHIIVIKKNRFFKVLHEVDGKQLTTAELEKQFEQVIKLGDTYGPAIGALTSENRDKWADFRDLLVKAGNEPSLKEIEAASFVVCFDEASPVTREERAHQYWHGDGKNRFYDKPLQFIVNKNGSSGFMGEHSMMDGTQTHRLNDFALDAIAKGKLEFGTSVRSNLPAPEEVKFNINSQIEEAIDESIADFHKVIGEHELSVFSYQGYGKNLIKKFKCSPDGYIQMIIQLAYYKYYGVSRPTYESAATRRFQLGRTETCRSVSTESVDFVKTMENPHATNAEKVAAARKALASQGNYINDASAGKGVDRHFFGLSHFIEGETPAIYNDPIFKYSKSWYLSTSQLSSEYYNGYGWSQVIDDGFGCAYMILNDSLNINIVSKKLGTEKLKFYLTEAADDLAAAFSSELTESAKL